MSFHELREALVYAFSDRLVINEEEFLILQEKYESGTNLNFPHQEYEPFSPDNFDGSEARTEFSVDKEDIPLLVNALQVPEIFDSLKEQVKLSAIHLSHFVSITEINEC